MNEATSPSRRPDPVPSVEDLDVCIREVGANVSVIEQTYAHVVSQLAPDLSYADMGRIGEVHTIQ